MEILRSFDIENEVRKALSPFFETYCRPLPATFGSPCILVTQVGGTDLNKIDTVDIVLDIRATEDADAQIAMRSAIGILKAVAAAQTTEIRNATVISSGSWGVDPIRPDLAMCSARLQLVAHIEKANMEVRNGI